MFELISYCIVGGRLLWTLGLMVYMLIESAQDVQELEELCHSHTRSDW